MTKMKHPNFPTLIKDVKSPADWRKAGWVDAESKSDPKKSESSK